jgi:thiol-disulfide isomerase/thioredoxin
VLIRLFVILLLAAVVAIVARRYVLARRADASAGPGTFPPLPRGLRSPGRDTWVIFTTPLCVSCDAVEAELKRAHPEQHVIKIDATREPQLADRYRVRRAPTVVRTDDRGRVLDRFVGAEAILSS